MGNVGCKWRKPCLTHRRGTRCSDTDESWFEKAIGMVTQRTLSTKCSARNLGEVICDARLEYFELCTCHRCGCNMKARMCRLSGWCKTERRPICGECLLLFGSVGAIFLTNHFNPFSSIAQCRQPSQPRSCLVSLH